MPRKMLLALVNLDLILAGICMVLLLFATVFGVVMRYALNNPLTWLEEVQMLFIIWLVMFGGSGAFRLRAHVSIEILVDTMPPALQKAVRVVISLLVTGVLLFVAARGYDFVSRLAGAGRITNVLRFPQALCYAAVPVGAFLMLVNYWVAEIRGYYAAPRRAAGEEKA